MIGRRALVGALGCALLGLPPVFAAAGSTRTVRLGLLREGHVPWPKAFWDSLRDRGWIENQNMMAESRYSQRTELDRHAEELVRLEPDVIVTDGTPATRAAMVATATIPIVFSLAADPVASGLIANLARPGGNLTGFAFGLYEEKQLEILKQAAPEVTRVACPSNEPTRALGRTLAPALMLRADELLG